MQPRQKFIRYDAVEGSRKIAVFDEKPYYCSTGTASSWPNVWFPFLLMIGTKPLNYDALPSFLSKERIKKNPYQYPQYLLKFEACYCIGMAKRGVFNGVNPSTDSLADRLPTKETIIMSVRLSGEYFPQDKLERVDLTSEEKMLTAQPIFFEEKPVFITSTPDKVNEWLVAQGASVACALLPKLKVSIDDANQADELKPLQPTLQSLPQQTPKTAAFFKEKTDENRDKNLKKQSCFATCCESLVGRFR